MKMALLTTWTLTPIVLYRYLKIPARKLEKKTLLRICLEGRSNTAGAPPKIPDNTLRLPSPVTCVYYFILVGQIWERHPPAMRLNLHASDEKMASHLATTGLGRR